MLDNKIISIVIPCYKVRKHLGKVTDSIPGYVDNIFVIDDCCPEESFKVVESDSRVIIIHHNENQGVGGAVVTGYKEALKVGSDFVVKVDGDNQMDLDYLIDLIDPLLMDKADYTKGNRFSDFSSLKKMPKIRLFGNSVLSFMVKASSGYWNIMDPTNGYTVITKKALNGLDFDLLAKRYFFESDMLIKLNIESCVVKDIPIPARYNDEESSLNISKVIVQFPFSLLSGLTKRIFYKYFIYDFNMGSVYLLTGIPMLSIGLATGGYRWFQSIYNNIDNSVGAIMLPVLLITLGVQFILQAISIDIANIPEKIKS